MRYLESSDSWSQSAEGAAWVEAAGMRSSCLTGAEFPSGEENEVLEGRVADGCTAMQTGCT